MGDLNTLTRAKGRGSAERQARVGIVANPAEMPQKPLPPREIWTAWPRLRSARRLGRTEQATAKGQISDDLILSGALLNDFAKALRDKTLSDHNSPFSASQALLGRKGRSCSSPMQQGVLPAGKSRAAIWLVGLLCVASAGLIAGTWLGLL